MFLPAVYSASIRPEVLASLHCCQNKHLHVYRWLLQLELQQLLVLLLLLVLFVRRCHGAVVVVLFLQRLCTSLNGHLSPGHPLRGRDFFPLRGRPLGDEPHRRRLQPNHRQLKANRRLLKANRCQLEANRRRLQPNRRRPQPNHRQLQPTAVGYSPTAVSYSPTAVGWRPTAVSRQAVHQQ